MHVPRSTITVEEIAARKAMLSAWLERRLAADHLAWLRERLAKIAAGSHQDLAISIGLAPRKVGKADLDLNERERSEAKDARRGFDPSGWAVDQTARVLMVLSSYDGNDDAFASRLDRLFQSGEISEHIALLQGLPLYPAAELLVPRACEGVRSAMQPVFEAVAHNSPFPRDYFSEAQWNQMVVKTLFIGSRLAPIQGLDERRNADLAITLIDYAHERWAAGRLVSPELWRCVVPFARGPDVVDLAKVLEQGSETEAKAAALALSECPLPEARTALETVPHLAAAIRDRSLTWNDIA
jgi:hypothetical protein